MVSGEKVVKPAGELAVRVLAWEKFNPRKDVSNPSWLRFQHNFFEHPNFYSLTHSERVAWLYILCEASKANAGGKLTVNREHAHRVAGLDPTVIISALKKLQRFKMVEVRTLRGRYADGAQTGLTRRDETLRDETGRDDTTLSTASPIDDRGSGPDVLLDIWNSNCGSLPKAESLNSERRRKAAARWGEQPDPEYWTGIVRRIASSAFCLGESPSGWRANFDFLLKPATHVRTREGQYDRKSSRGRAAPVGALDRSEDLDSQIQSLMGNGKNADVGTSA